MSAATGLPVSLRRGLLVALECCGLAAAGAAAATFFWALVTPTGSGETALPAASVPGSNISAFPGVDPFFRGGAPLAGAAGPAAAQDYTLHATRVAGPESSAILSGAGLPQNTYRVGESVGDARLSSVLHDRVTLDRDGKKLTILFPAATSTALPDLAAGFASSGAAANAVDFPGLSPLSPGEQNVGYRVDAGSGLLAAAGFQTGDILIAVDGEALSAASLRDLQARLASGGEAEIRFERYGQTMTRRIGGGAQ